MSETIVENAFDRDRIDDTDTNVRGVTRHVVNVAEGRDDVDSGVLAGNERTGTVRRLPGGRYSARGMGQ